MMTHIPVPQKLYLMQLSTTTVQGTGRTLEMVLGCYLILIICLSYATNDARSFSVTPLDTFLALITSAIAVTANQTS